MRERLDERAPAVAAAATAAAGNEPQAAATALPGRTTGRTVVSGPRPTYELVERLSRDGDPGVRATAARDPRLSPACASC
ncbi:hypothetical protein OHT93_10370 [Streptomyces sp. NBC_00191]|uniref:hypothetical protein n=1 Tax=Streptomyces sp. NBC_00191 TaxID=2975674 RepID=UPI003244A1F2